MSYSTKKQHPNKQFISIINDVSELIKVSLKTE